MRTKEGFESSNGKGVGSLKGEKRFEASDEKGVEATDGKGRCDSYLVNHRETSSVSSSSCPCLHLKMAAVLYTPCAVDNITAHDPFARLSLSDQGGAVHGRRIICDVGKTA